MDTTLHVSNSRWRIFRIGSRRGWLTVAGALPLLGLLNNPPDAMLPIFTIFVGLWWVRDHLQRATDRLRLPWWTVFPITMIGAGLLTEVLSWWSSAAAGEAQPGGFHPDFVPNLLLSVIFYSSWTIAWIVLRTRYGYSVPEMFVYQGLYGVLVEQFGAVFIAGLLGLPAGLLVWVYVVLVYGSVAGIAALPVERVGNAGRRPDATRRRKTLITFAALFGSTYLLAAPVYWLAGRFT